MPNPSSGRAILALPLALGLLAMASSSAQAQSSSMFGNRLSNPAGATPSPSIGGFGSIANSASPFSSGGSGSRSGGGMSSLGIGSQSGLGASGGGMGTSGTSGSGFVGRSNAGQFIGVNSQNGTQGGAAGRNGQFNQFQGQGGRGSAMNRGFNTNGSQGFNMGGQGGENAPPGAAKLLHPQQRVNFTYQPPAADAPSRSLAVRFEHLASRPALRGVNGLQFDMQGNVLVLRGSVESEETKKLVGMLAGLEPGVRRVRNELTVGSGIVPIPPPALDLTLPSPVTPRK